MMEQDIINIMIEINKSQNGSYDNIDYISVLKDMVKKEVSTVDYLLRALEYNYIGDEPFNIIKNNNMNQDTCDFAPTHLDTLDNYKLILPNVKSRLIMVFGPSASGKTTCGKKMIHKILVKCDNFPTCFMTVDGGKLRQASIVFQIIIKQANIHNIDIVSHNIFPKVKNTIIKYYESQIAKYNTMISLYIPITLGKSYIQSYSHYIEMTKDYNWIGIFVWQHKFDCVYEGEYRCNGCNKSGREREKIEGKKYKMHKWELSMERGLSEVKKAKGGFYCIHNGGRDDSIMMFDLEYSSLLN